MLIVDRDLDDAAATPYELIGRGLAAEVGAINVAPRWATPALVAAARAAGLAVSAGTVNDAEGSRGSSRSGWTTSTPIGPDRTVPALRG